MSERFARAKRVCGSFVEQRAKRDASRKYRKNEDTVYLF